MFQNLVLVETGSGTGDLSISRNQRLGTRDETVHPPDMVVAKMSGEVVFGETFVGGVGYELVPVKLHESALPYARGAGEAKM